MAVDASFLNSHWMYHSARAENEEIKVKYQGLGFLGSEGLYTVLEIQCWKIEA